MVSRGEKLDLGVLYMPNDLASELMLKRDVVFAAVEWAAQEVVLKDSHLLEFDIQEEAISHRFAVYLEQRLQSESFFHAGRFAVDTEYDRTGLDPKQLEGLYDGEIPLEERNTPVRPDVIVHQRGDMCSLVNLLAVEIKKRSRATPDSECRKFALWKCQGYRTLGLRYIFSAYLSFETGPYLIADSAIAERVFFDGTEPEVPRPPRRRRRGRVL